MEMLFKEPKMLITAKTSFWNLYF